jgi:tetratricopeptide (TPR) repeat protein
MFLEAMTLHSAQQETEQAKILPLLDKVYEGWKQLKDDYMSNLTERQYLYVKVAQDESINQRDLSIYLNSTKKELLDEVTAIVRAGLIFRKFQARKYEANMLLRYGYIKTLLGEVEVGLKSFNKALSIQKSIGYKRGEAISHFIIGRTLHLLGESQKGLDYLTKALEVFKRIEEKAGEALTLANLGSVYEDLGDYKKALEFYNQAVDKAKAADDDITYFDTWEAITNLAVIAGKSQIVIEYYETILEFRKQVGDKRGEANTLHSLAFAYNEWNEKQNALEYYQQSVLISKVIGDKQGEAVTFNNLMFVYDSLNQSSLAIFFGKQATNKYQELRQSIQGLDKETQKKFLNTIEGTYQKLADSLPKDVLPKHNKFSRCSKKKSILDMSDAMRTKSKISKETSNSSPTSKN